MLRYLIIQFLLHFFLFHVVLKASLPGFAFKLSAVTQASAQFQCFDPIRDPIRIHDGSSCDVASSVISSKFLAPVTIDLSIIHLDNIILCYACATLNRRVITHQH